MAGEVSSHITDRTTDRQTDKHDNYSNPRCACAPRVNENDKSEGREKLDSGNNVWIAPFNSSDNTFNPYIHVHTRMRIVPANCNGGCYVHVQSTIKINGVSLNGNHCGGPGFCFL